MPIQLHSPPNIGAKNYKIPRFKAIFKHPLKGILVHPKDAVGIVLFVHGSGSSRLSPRNQMVAGELSQAGHATLLFDLLTEEEEEIDDQTREFRFDIELLTKRLIEVTQFIQKYEATRGMKIGYFGASTGAVAALKAAGALGQKVSAVVSRGGRPDLAGESLTRVIAPTLLIVGSKDTQVIAVNEQAFGELGCEKKLELIDGASHLFEENGTLVQVADFAQKWFLKCF